VGKVSKKRNNGKQNANLRPPRAVQ